MRHTCRPSLVHDNVTALSLYLNCIVYTTTTITTLTLPASTNIVCSMYRLTSVYVYMLSSMFSVLVQFERVTQQHKGSGSTGNRVSVAWMDANYIDLCAVALAPSSTTGRFFLSLQIAIYGSVWVALGGGGVLFIDYLLTCMLLYFPG